ncbi:AAA family ATPase [Streptomyces polygonati]|uniref:AAA family ATPase n=1 Tax=Streptomyces polygonati TaxID=1617087 RepID=A0ABV8HUT5_9ACTN
MSSINTAFISSVGIEDLFGVYTYDLDFSGEGENESRGRRLTLLYGNNGSGKTTILKLLWDTLSADPSKGHREGLAKTPFRSLEINLTSGDKISVKKRSGLTGSFTVTVANQDSEEINQNYLATQSGVVAIPESLWAEAELMDATDRHIRMRLMRAKHSMKNDSDELDFSDKFVIYLSQLQAVPYMLADDRQIYGDAIESTSEEDEEWQFEDEDNPSATTLKGVTAELNHAIERVDDMVKDQVIKGGQRGSRSSNDVYLGILGRVAETDPSKDEEVTKELLIGRIDEVAARTRVYSQYGLLPRIDRDQFISAVEGVPDSKLAVAEAVLEPFLSAQTARLDALSGVFHLVQTFTNEMNRFFANSGKRITYRTSGGIQVRSKSQRLSPEQLSSGERQILLLLLNTILARENTKLFLIDEPEISLNVKWQRQLMDALLACTEGSSVQFIVATHSIEVITGHRKSLARMIPKKKRLIEEE